MAVRVVFRCEHCVALPDEITHRTLSSQLRDRTLGRFLDAQPGGWLIWTGGGALGPKRYACPEHREDLVEYLRVHYGAMCSGVRESEPYQALWPAGFSGFDEQDLVKLLSGEERPAAPPARGDIVRPRRR